MDRFKMEVASELGVPLSNGYNGNLTSAQNGSVTTGFMPYTYNAPLIIRMKGAEWLGATDQYGGHFYFNVYDTGKTFKNGFACTSLDNYKDEVSVTYDDATGVTTFDFTKADGRTSVFANALKAGGYIRINAYGKGADLIITKNEEIT
jgi:hypothetical protein